MPDACSTSKAINRAASPLLTDLYQLNMMQAYLKGGRQQTAVFEFCVLWSAEDAHRQGFEVVVVADACRSLDVEGSDAHAQGRLQTLHIGCVAGAEISPGLVSS